MKKINKKLTLKAEAVRDLSLPDMRRVNGGTVVDSHCKVCEPTYGYPSCWETCQATCASTCHSVFGTQCMTC